MAATVLFVVGLLAGHRCSFFSLPYWLPCLVVGSVCALRGDRWHRLLLSVRRRLWLRRLLTVAVVATQLAGCLLLPATDVQNIWFHLWLMASPLCVMLLFGVYDVPSCDWLLRYVGPYTFFIYCTHTFFVNLAAIVVHKVLPTADVVVASAMVFALAFVSDLLVGMVLSRLRPLWLLLTGFRAR